MQPLLSRIRLLMLYTVLALPVVIFGAVHALQSSNNSPIDWVDSSFTERRVYDEFVELFGPGDAVVASWPGCEWTDERLDTLVHRLRHAKSFRATDGSPLFYEVRCGRESLLNMTTSDDTTHAESTQATDLLPNESSDEFVPVDEEESGEPAARIAMPHSLALQRLRGSMIGPDGRTTCVIVILNRAGLAIRAKVVDNLRQAIHLTCKVPTDEIHMAGPVIDGLTVDEASHRSLTNFAAPSTIIIFLICWWSLGSVLHGVIVFLTASFCQAVLLAVIYYSGQRLSALLIVLPPLVQVLSVSGGIHLMNYYLNSLASMPPRQAAIDAFHKGWLPSLLSLGTTAIGTASLMVSGLEPIRLFGVYGTVGVLLTCATVLTIIPCSMILLGRKSETRTKLDHNPAKITADHSGVWFRLTRLLQTRNTIALVLLMGLMTAGLFGLPKLRTSIRIETLFAHDSRIMLDYHWLEEHLGPLVPIEVLVMFSDESNLNDRLRMNLLWHINDTIVRLPHIQSSTSALTVFPPLPKMKSLPETMRLAMLNKAIHQARPAFQQMAMLRDTADGEVWRITAHISALETLDYGEILQSVRASINQTLQQESLKSSGATVLTSGIMPLVHQIQGQLLNDLFYSLLSALGVITLTMTIVEAGLLSGLITMLSNVFPVIIMFGCMGWLQHPMDIGSVMTASVALGIAVDDTLHFLAFFRRSRSLPEATRFSAVLSAYQHCGPAMIQTSLSCGLGLLVFALSDFLPTSRFAVMMSGLLLLALLGDLLLLPALLLSPAGRFFETHEQPPLSPADGDSSPQVDDGAFV